jgi:hypothetical protein
VSLGEKISAFRKIIVLSFLGLRSCSSVTKYQSVQYLTRWRTRLMWFFSTKFVCPFWSSPHLWALYLGPHKSIFTHLAHTQGEGIYPENEENTIFRDFGNFIPYDTALQPRRVNVFLLLIRGICVSVKSFPTYGVSTYHSALLLFASRSSLLKQARKYLRKLLNMSSSCQTPRIGRPCSKILLQFENKTPLNKLRNLSVSLRIGPWRFWS